MANSPISFMKHVTKILLCMMVLKLVTVPAIIRKGDFILLDNELDDLLYYEVSHHQWHLCNINLTELTTEDFYKYTRGGYISNDCYRKNFKKNNDLKYAIFMTGSSDKHLGPPMCPPLISGESYYWRCEKDMMSSAVTPYRNCTSVCKEGFYTVNNVTVRCSFRLDWIWFGNDTTPRCESRSPSSIAPPSNPNIPVHTTSTPITDVNWILKNLTSLPLNSTSSRLTWTVSPLQKENPFPHTYRLSYRVKGKTTYKEIILNGGSVNHTLTNLQKETVYDIQLCALSNKDRNKFCINMTTHITADKPEVDASIIGGSIAGVALICIAVIMAMYCYCKKNRSRGPYVAVPGRLSSSSSTSSQCNSRRCCCCFQNLNNDISLDDIVETSESTDTSNYEDKNENNNAKDTDKEKKLVDSGREMCPIDSENIKEQLEDLSSELSENKNSRKTDESQPVDSGGEMHPIHLQKNERQLEDDSSEFSENENSGKTEESQTVDSGGEMCPIDSHKNEKQLDDLSFENSEIESLVKPVETQTAEDNKQDLSDRPNSTAKNLITISDGSFKNDKFKVCGHLSVDKEGDRVTLGAAPSLSSLMDGSSGYASGMRNISVDLNRNDNRSHEAENIVGSSVSTNMVAMEYRPGPSSIQEYHNDQMNQLIYSAQGVDPIIKPDSIDFNRVQDESSDQYHSIGQVACEQETYCDQRFPRVQRSSSSSGITRSDPGHDGRSQSSAITDILQNQETFPTKDEFDANITNLLIPQSNATNSNIQRSRLASTICTLSVEKAKEKLSPEFFQILAYHLDPDSIYGKDKSWYGLTRAVLQWSEEKVKSIRHHTMGNTERGHFHETLEAYTAENKYMSDIVKYFVRQSSLRPDVIQFIKRYHTDCPVCNALYLQVNRNMSMSQSTQDIRRISTTHHENNS